MECQICGSITKFLDNYKYNVKYDRNFFGDIKIYNCNECNFSFSHPLPKKENLLRFYKNIYRDIGRPHFYKKDEKLVKSDINLSYLKYLENYLSLKNINEVFDIGPGPGEFGYLIKNKYNNISLNCSELDQFSMEYLQLREFNNYDNIDNIDKKFDLLISLHSLEHFSKIDSFFNTYEKILKSKGYIFFEVPNCPFDKGFEKRPYDSPHLLFFTQKSLEILFTKKDYKIINLQEFNPSQNLIFKEMLKSKRKHENWTPEKKNKDSLKDVLKSYIPLKIKKTINKYLNKTNPQQDKYVPTEKNSTGWAIRGIVQKR